MSFMGFKNVPDILSGIILVLDFLALYELVVALMGGMASSYDEPMDVEAEVRCCIVLYSVPLDVWRSYRLFSVSDLS